MIAAHYLRQAGDEAMRSAALVEAARYYQSAADHWPVTDTAGRAGVLRKLGESRWMIGWPRQALDVFQVAYYLFEALSDRQAAGAMQRFIGRMHWELSDRVRDRTWANRVM